MYNFNFYNPTHIVFGKDRLHELDSLIPQDNKVLVLYGGGSVKKFGTLSKIKAALGDREVLEFGGIESNPQFDTVMKAVDLVKKENVDFLLAVGGGSVIDGTKFVAMASKYEGNNIEDLLYSGFAPAPITDALPLGTVVTIPATGSEMNPCAVISYNQGKHLTMSPLIYPKFSFLDPEITFTLPTTQIANGVVDAFIHTIEQYVTFPVDARIQDRTAEGILQTLVEIGKETIDNPTNYDTRANLVWSATMALNGLIGVGVPQDWTAHMIGHELTVLFGIDHGKTLAILQPSIWKLRKDKKSKKLLQYAERVWHINEGSEEEKIQLAIEKTKEFFESLGVKTHLSDYNISKDKIDEIINHLEKHGLTALSETQDLTLDIVRQILEDAM